MEGVEVIPSESGFTGLKDRQDKRQEGTPIFTEVFIVVGVPWVAKMQYTLSP